MPNINPTLSKGLFFTFSFFIAYACQSDNEIGREESSYYDSNVEFWEARDTVSFSLDSKTGFYHRSISYDHVEGKELFSLFNAPEYTLYIYDYIV